MTKWIQELVSWQRVAIKATFMVLGIALTVLPFYAGGLEMVGRGEGAEWGTMHWIFEAFGAVFISASLSLKRTTSMFDIAVTFFRRIAGKSDGDEVDRKPPQRP